MRITINGEAVDVDVPVPVAAAAAAGLSLDALLALRGVPQAQVAVELNGRVVRRAERAVVVVNDGDVLEIVTLVGGG